MICMGLVRVHKYGVHRDLSPKNIFLKKMKNGFTIPKIGDFGLVKPKERFYSKNTMK
jgi:serine/threonine protein kinase